MYNSRIFCKPCAKKNLRRQPRSVLSLSPGTISNSESMLAMGHLPAWKASVQWRSASYDPSCRPSFVGQLVYWLVVGLSLFSKIAESYTSMCLMEHLLVIGQSLVLFCLVQKDFFALPTQNCLAKLHKILNFVKIIGRLLSCPASEKQTQACNTKSGHGSWTRTSARKFAFSSAISLFSQRFFK